MTGQQSTPSANIQQPPEIAGLIKGLLTSWFPLAPTKIGYSVFGIFLLFKVQKLGGHSQK